MRYVSDIMDKNFYTVKALDCVSNIKDIAFSKKINYFPVQEDDRIIGVITYKELITAHPNRIAADAMTKNFIYINYDMPIYEAKGIFEERNLDLFLVVENNNIVGTVTSFVLDIEFGKHIDLLTGLHKTNYIFYHALELIENGVEISIIFIDVNNFGIIDKKYGHIHGDKVLKEIALLLDRNKPRGTFLCRFGGDEFVLLTPFKADIAKKVAEDLLEITSARTYQNEIKITISAGISGGRRYNRKTEDVYSTIINLINLASLACSEAKKDTNQSSIEFGTDITVIA